MNILQTFTNSR